MQMKTKCIVADNSGAIKVECFHVYNKKKKAEIGDIIKVAVKEVTPISKIKKGAVKTAVVIKSKIGQKFIDGSRVKFDQYEVILVEPGLKGVGYVPISARSTGLVPTWISSGGNAAQISKITKNIQLKTLQFWPFELAKTPKPLM